MDDGFANSHSHTRDIPVNESKRKKLGEAGWKVGDTNDFLKQHSQARCCMTAKEKLPVWVVLFYGIMSAISLYAAFWFGSLPFTWWQKPTVFVLACSSFALAVLFATSCVMRYGEQTND